MSKPSPQTVAKAIETRDRAIAFVQARGTWVGAGGDRILFANTDTLKVAYRTPFQRRFHAGESDASRYERAVRGIKGSLPYGLDAWANGRKVLNIEWNDAGEVELLSYRPGEWEATLQ